MAHTGNIDVLDNVKNVILIDLSLMLSIKNVINGTFQSIAVHTLGICKLPAQSNKLL